MAIPNFTTTEESLLREVAAAWQADNVATMQAVKTLLTVYGVNFKSTPVIQTVRISSGVATVERLAIFSYANLGTEGDQPTDILDSISTTGFNRGDFLLIGVAATGRSISVSGTGNLQAPQFVLNDPDTSMLLLTFTGTNWLQIGQFPQPSTSKQVNTVTLDTSTGLSDVTCLTNWTKVLTVDLSTETLATGTVTVTGATGTSGSFSVVVDTGSGFPIEIASVTYAAATTNNAQASAIDTAINAGTSTHGYTSTVLGNVVTIEPPDGTGALANSYTIGVQVQGGATATDVDFSGGVSASESNHTLTEINGLIGGTEVIFTNANTSATITLTTVGGNIHSSAAGVMAAGTSKRLILDTDLNKVISV